MDSTLLRAFATSLFAVGIGTMAHAQPGAQNFDIGKYEYDGHCAICHGTSGKGDGPFEGLLKSGTVVPDLTALSKKNNGVFPFAHVYETIDGTVLTKAHGTKDMPIWGRVYEIKSYYLNPDHVAEEFVRAKILALTEYVYRLQTK